MLHRSETTVSSAVASGGTITFSYPSGTNAGTFAGGRAHKMFAAGLQAYFEAPTNFTVSFGAASITVTYNGTTSIPAGTRVQAQFDAIGKDDRDPYDPLTTKRTYCAPIAVVTLGSPITSDADGVSTSASITAAAGAVIDGALASGGVATFDVPRNVIITSAGDDSAKTFTVTGTDEYGVTVKETITGANADVASGKKAFKTVTAVAISANSASTVTIGTGDVLGLPFFLPGTAHVFRELQDGSAATAGTVVKGDASKATATTGDVRGTYDPNAACDGAKAFQLMVVGADPTDHGNTQYS